MVAHLHFRPSEITLLLQPRNFVPDANTRVSDDDLLLLSKLTDERLTTQNARLGPAGERLPVITPDGSAILQTFSLKGWKIDLPSGDFPEGIAELNQRLVEVTQAVGALNGLQDHGSGPSDERELGDFTILAASPNWLLYPMDDCGGCPGGPPSKHMSPARSKSFNLSGEVDALVASVLGPIGPDAAQDVRVAILDTFPIEGFHQHGAREDKEGEEE